MGTMAHQSPTAAGRSRAGLGRSRAGQGWALAACLILVILSLVGMALYVVTIQVVFPARVAVMLAVASWFYLMSGPVTLLGLAATSLRRLVLSIVAIVVGLVHGSALLVLLFLNLADLSVTAGVLSPGTVGLAAVAVGLTTAGAVLALFRPRSRWPITATIGLVIAAGGSMLCTVEESIVGPLLPAIGAARTLSPLDFLVPAAIVLMGLAVARGNWSLASAATVALLASTVIVVVMFVRNVGFYVVDERGMWWSLQSILATVEGLLATGAAVALTASLLRARRTTPAP